MSNSNGKITAPVSIADIQKVLGKSSNDVGTLCTSDNVNKWSKSKPYDIYFSRYKFVQNKKVSIFMLSIHKRDAYNKIYS